MKKIIIPLIALLLTSEITAFAQDGVTVEQPVTCIEIFEPVCGIIDPPIGITELKTFSNSCKAGLENAEIIHDGECIVTEITEEEAIKITQEIGFERIEVGATITIIDSDGNEKEITTLESPLSGIIPSQIPQANLVISSNIEGDVTGGRIKIKLDFQSNDKINDFVDIVGAITVHSTYRNSDLIGECSITTDENISFDESISKFKECLNEQSQLLIDLEENGDYFSQFKDFAFSKRTDRTDGFVEVEILNQRFDELLKISNRLLEKGEYILNVDLKLLTFTSGSTGVSYFLNFQEIPLLLHNDFITLRDPFFIGFFDVDNDIELKEEAVNKIVNPIPENEELLIIGHSPPPQDEGFFAPLTNFFKGLAIFFSGLFS